MMRAMRLMMSWVILIFYSCQKEEIPQDFLEKYHNTYWEAEDGGSQNIGFYNDPLQFIFTASCSRAGFGDFVIEEADDFLITKNVLKYEGDEAFMRAFELLGEIAFLSLMEEATVSNALENYVTHIDPEFLRKFD